ncbi:hypothetical protein L484_024550 [Morus notabilis]|uniref:Uncharacterized protein n=1 Tax=Morus notabilis TaxID=981085 RepID=W9RHP2_9ROSA|nr:hypothetical protein L484_024550 [Morus notabilis]
MSSDKSKNLSNSPSVCGKVVTAIFCCTCQKDNNVSDHEHEHMPAKTTTNILASTRDHPMKASGVQTKTQRVEVAENKMAFPSKETAEKGGHGRTNAEIEGKKSNLAKNEMFSDYINRAKAKMRTLSGLGSEKQVSEPDSVHCTKKDNSGMDAFSEYINRAKMKIKKTSSMGTRKSNSLK